MRTIRASYTVKPQIEYRCSECGRLNRYTRMDAKRPQTVDCIECGAEFKPRWNDEDG